ncbi:MAG: transcription termination factor NusA [Desulfovibrionaceae bacterium]|nr:transcription termination factor NusA [Desulfovibrionaceae bacterium]
MGTELKKALEQISKDKGFSKEELIHTIEEAVRISAVSKYGEDYDLEVRYNDATGELELYQFKLVVEKVRNPAFEISIEEARQHDPSVVEGEDMGFQLEIGDMGRIAARFAKQVLVQRMRESEQQLIYNEYIDRRGDIVSGIVQRRDKHGWIVNLGKTEALLLKSEQIPKEFIKRGDKVDCLLLEVNKTAKLGAQLILSRSHPEYLHALFRREVPEIDEGIVQVVSIVRDPGVRAKVAVFSRDKDIDPVGACVGVRGFRIQNVMQEIRGERIDIVVWNADISIYARNALSPALVSKIIVDEENNRLEVVVPNDQLSNAIGRRGQNIKLVTKLIGWKVDIYPESKYAGSDSSIKILEQLANVAEISKETLLRAGYKSLQDLQHASDEVLMETLSVTYDTVSALRSAINFMLPDEESDDEVLQEDE